MNDHTERVYPLGERRTYDQQTRELVEDIIQWMEATGNGHSFVEWFKRNRAAS